MPYFNINRHRSAKSLIMGKYSSDGRFICQWEYSLYIIMSAVHLEFCVALIKIHINLNTRQLLFFKKVRIEKVRRKVGENVNISNIYAAEGMRVLHNFFDVH
jgi:hypothetical protein